MFSEAEKDFMVFALAVEQMNFRKQYEYLKKNNKFIAKTPYWQFRMEAWLFNLNGEFEK